MEEPQARQVPGNLAIMVFIGLGCDMVLGLCVPMEHVRCVARDKTAGDQLADDVLELFERHFSHNNGVNVSSRDMLQFFD